MWVEVNRKRDYSSTKKINKREEGEIMGGWKFGLDIEKRSGAHEDWSELWSGQKRYSTPQAYTPVCSMGG